MKVIPEAVFTTLDIYVFITMTYCGLSILQGTTNPVISVLALTWFIRYINYINLQLLHNVIIIQTKVLDPQDIDAVWDFGLSCLGPMVYFLPQNLIYCPIFRFSAYLI